MPPRLSAKCGNTVAKFCGAAFPTAAKNIVLRNLISTVINTRSNRECCCDDLVCTTFLKPFKVKFSLNILRATNFERFKEQWVWRGFHGKTVFCQLLGFKIKRIEIIYSSSRPHSGGLSSIELIYHPSQL